MAIMTGGGYFSTVINGKLFAAAEPVGWALNSSGNSVITAEKLVKYQKVISGVFQGSLQFEMTLKFQAITWQVMQLALGQESTVAASNSVPTLKYATVPLLTPFTITDPLITDVNVGASMLFNTATKLAQPLTRVVGVPATAYEYSVTPGTNLLTFHADLAGQQIAYLPKKVYTACDVIGVTSDPVFIRQIQFNGITGGDSETGNMIIEVPNAQFQGFGGIDLEGAVTIESKYSMIPVISGQPLPFKLSRPLVL
jgi:hypothetical protein